MAALEAHGCGIPVIATNALVIHRN
ncbi:hypothetical protein OK016_18560 [Vibrio chagasii]|nr:hypothetical protein [Vibrio chagasii]